MWIIMNDSFVSVVKDKKSNNLVIRSRNFDDLLAIVPSNKIIITEDRDYRFRTWMNKKEFSKIIANRIEAIDYPNFKDSVKQKDRHHFYQKVWQVLFFFDRKRRYDSFGLDDEQYGFNEFAGYY